MLMLLKFLTSLAIPISVSSTKIDHHRLRHVTSFCAGRETGVAERLTTQQQQEVDAFLDAIIDTQPMRFVHQQLTNNVSIFQETM